MSDNLKPVDKLNALGIKFPQAQRNPLREEFNALKSGIDSLTDGFTTFQNDVSNQSSFDEFETYLESTLGLSAETAATLRNKISVKYGDFSTFQTELNSFSTFNEWENSFIWGDLLGGETTADGVNKNSGIRFHSEAGLTQDGVEVPAGSVEIFGPEIHFAHTGQTADVESDKSTILNWSNMSVDASSITLGTTSTFSADITNNGSYPETVTPGLFIDHELVATKDLVTVGAGDSKTITFGYTFGDLGVYEVKINKTSTVSVTVSPGLP
jgi:hypothetical protein